MLKFQKSQQSKKPYAGTFRVGHSITYAKIINCIVVIGGTKDQDVFSYNLSSLEWNLHQTTGKKIGSRKYHRAVYSELGEGIVIHGGQSENTKYCDEFHILLVREWRWKKITCVKLPSSRQLHSLTLLRIASNQILIFGGLSIPMKKPLNDVWILQPIHKKQQNNNEYFGNQCVCLETKGDLPTPRASFTSTFFGQKFYVMGGQLESHTQSTIIYALNLKKKVWKKSTIKVNSKDTVLPSIQHILSFSDQEIILIYGSTSMQNQTPQFYTLDIQDMVLKKIPSKWSDVPKEQCELYPALIEKNNHLFNFVGWNKNISKPLMMTCTLQNTVNNKFSEEDDQVSIESYLLAIKNQQVLSQQIGKKNDCLQNLFKQMQSYITLLYREYRQNGEEEDSIEREKEKQIKYCLQLKEQYSYLESVSNQANNNIKALRRELGNIDEHFQRCMETEIDQDM